MLRITERHTSGKANLPAIRSVCGEFGRKVWSEIEPPINLQSLEFLPGGLHWCFKVVTCVGIHVGGGEACSTWSSQSVNTAIIQYTYYTATIQLCLFHQGGAKSTSEFHEKSFAKFVFHYLYDVMNRKMPIWLSWGYLLYGSFGVIYYKMTNDVLKGKSGGLIYKTVMDYFKVMKHHSGKVH
jgi:hypothetical protein